MCTGLRKAHLTSPDSRPAGIRLELYVIDITISCKQTAGGVIDIFSVALFLNLGLYSYNQMICDSISLHIAPDSHNFISISIIIAVVGIKVISFNQVVFEIAPPPVPVKPT